MATSSSGASALSPVSRPRLYVQLVERLLDFIAESGISPGDRLPTERDLAKRLNVSRASVAQAVVALEVQGVLTVRHGDGIYLVGRVDPRRSVEEIVRRRRRLPEILEARETLEVRITTLAAERRTAHDMAAIDAALADMEREVDEGGHGYDGDMRFHGAVTAAAHNPVLSGLMDILAESITETRRESLAQPGRPHQSVRSHRRIAEAIRSGDATKAARAARSHIKLVSSVALVRWGQDGEG